MKSLFVDQSCDKSTRIFPDNRVQLTVLNELCASIHSLCPNLTLCTSSGRRFARGFLWTQNIRGMQYHNGTGNYCSNVLVICEVLLLFFKWNIFHAGYFRAPQNIYAACIRHWDRKRVQQTAQKRKVVATTQYSIKEHSIVQYIYYTLYVFRFIFRCCFPFDSPTISSRYYSK